MIIGLIIGGILTGQSLIDIASQRAQLAQIEHYNTAVRTFQNKYGFLPGDIPNPYATEFGFLLRGAYTGEGDGDGLLVGITQTNGCVGCSAGSKEAGGETVMIWVDLSAAGLIDGTFNTAKPDAVPGADITGSAIGSYFPAAKIGEGNYVYAWSNTINYWGVSAVTDIAQITGFGKLDSNQQMTVLQAYNIDKKIDDGLPQSGAVEAIYLTSSNGIMWTDGTNGYNPPSASAAAGSPITCMDNSISSTGTPGVAGPKHYSIEMNGGGGQNCALSFRLQ